MPVSKSGDKKEQMNLLKTLLCDVLNIVASIQRTAQAQINTEHVGCINCIAVLEKGWGTSHPSELAFSGRGAG